MTVNKASEFPRRHRQVQVKEGKKSISWKGIPQSEDDLRDARTIHNEELPETLQSEAFDVSFSDFSTRDRSRRSLF